MHIAPHIPKDKSPAELTLLYMTAEKAVMTETRDIVVQWAEEKMGTNWLETVKVESEMWAIADWQDERDPLYVFKCLRNGKYCPLRHALGDPYGLDDSAKRVLDARNAWAHYSMDWRPSAIQQDIMNLMLFGEKVKLTAAKQIRATLKALDTLPDGPGPIETRSRPVAVAPSDTKALRRPRIGEPWEGELPSTRCDLNRKLHDIRVVATGESLKSRWTETTIADQEIDRWLRLKPTPSTLYVDESDGATVGFIEGYPYLFGYAGQEPEIAIGQYRGFFDPRQLEYHSGSLIERGTGKDFLGSFSGRARVLDSLLGMNIPDESTIRVTNYGDLVLIDDNGARRVATIPADDFLGLV